MCVAFLAMVIDVVFNYSPTTNNYIGEDDSPIPPYTGLKLITREDTVSKNKDLDVPDFAKTRKVYDQKEKKRSRRRSVEIRGRKQAIKKIN